MKLWDMIKTQLRVSFDGVYGLDLGAIATVFTIVNVGDIEWQIRKMNLIFDEFYGKK